MTLNDELELSRNVELAQHPGLFRRLEGPDFVFDLPVDSLVEVLRLRVPPVLLGRRVKGIFETKFAELVLVLALGPASTGALQASGAAECVFELPSANRGSFFEIAELYRLAVFSA
jgi:hypothetical protein